MKVLFNSFLFFFKKPWLLLPASLSHSLGPFVLPITSFLSNVFFSTQKDTWQSFDWKGLHFKNPAGIAGGVDKTGNTIKSWQRLGAGFIEVGTVTPLPQTANPGKIIDRSIKHLALWNKMGFPNDGAKNLKIKLAGHSQENLTKKHIPLFINIGKNRDTSNNDAAKDYVTCLNQLHEHADAFVINISSPNTKNLRDLQNADSLKKLLLELQHANNQFTSPKPLLLKLSPDTAKEQLSEVIQTSLDCNISGWILTNTTNTRPHGITFPNEGGMSGKPLANISKKFLKDFTEILGDRKKDNLIVSAGGIDSIENINERINLGADLVQVYSALIFQGPFFFKNLAVSANKSN